MFTFILQDEGYQVTTAASPEEASSLLSNCRFDLIVTEAFDQADRYHFDPAFLQGLASPNVPIILCSIHPSAETIRPRDFGLAEVIHKPFTIEELVGKVKKVLGG
ncbi:MAG: hypothetical protein M1305_04420 [Candidatus Marsarchaeota archaeon]|nr:hypothetical protein [Candidatus Marsarchaeota archaeon]